jgi:cell wall assembly regulator SMI1
LLASEGFTIEKNITLMFPLDILSTVFTHDGQRLRSDQGSSHQANNPDVTPLLAALMKTVYDECREFKTAWRCVVGSARKI